MRGKYYHARRSVDSRSFADGDFRLRNEIDCCAIVWFGGSMTAMARSRKAQNVVRKPRVVPTAESIGEMIAYMQRERHLIRHLVERMDKLEASMRGLAASGTTRDEWQRLERQVTQVRNDMKDLQKRWETPPQFPE